MNITEAISKRDIPDVLSPFGKRINDAKEFEAVKPRIKKLIEEEEYGKIPPAPDRIEVESLPVDYHEQMFAGGTATFSRLRLTAYYGEDSASFVFCSTVPNVRPSKTPIFINVTFGEKVAAKYQPTEELTDNGSAVFTINYTDVTSDDGDFTSGCAAVLCKDRAAHNAPGKIAIWAWSIMRVIDYVETLDIYSPDSIAVIGHSRLGKTALVAAAFDERIKFVCANNSGCSGSAITRGEEGERIASITKNFPFWFCPAYAKYAGREEHLPFDQHYLLALIAPRHILVGTAALDTWADPASEYLSLAMTDAVYKLYGSSGFLHPETIPESPVRLADGDCYYHLRAGEHCLCRRDWLSYLDYIKSKLN